MLPYRTLAGKRTKYIRYSNNAGFDWNIPASQPVWITFSIQSFVVVFCNVAKNVEISEGFQSEIAQHAIDQLPAFFGVRFHDFLFAGVEQAGFKQDTIRNADFSDIVQRGE